MMKSLFLTTAIVTASFMASNALAEDITQRQVIENGEEAVFDDVTARSIISEYNGAAIYNDGKITILNSTFTRNKAIDSDTSGGGAIYNGGYAEASNSVFSKNVSGWGGAIGNYDELKLTNVDFIENVAEAADRDYGGNGGAIYNYWSLNVDGGSFSKNTAFDGGAIFNRNKAKVSSMFTDNSAFLGGAVYNEYKMTISDSSFNGNRAKIDGVSSLLSADGGAVYNEGNVDISNTVFYNNEADGSGGALYNEEKAIIANSTFYDNEVERYGGAIYNESSVDISEDSINITDSVFSGNKAMGNLGSPSLGGAIYNYRGKMTIANSVFVENEAVGSAASAGGAISASSTILSKAIIDVSDSSFYKNKSSWGGAVENLGEMNLTNVLFSENIAEYNPEHGGDGGAVHNGFSATGPVTITNGTFVNNLATGDGGAISNRGNMSLKGKNFFEGNQDGKGLNDIHNQGKINIEGDVYLDGGISGYRGSSNYGTVIFAEGTNLTVKAGMTTISKNNVVNNGATLYFDISNGFSGNHELITDNSTLDNEFTVADNGLYNISLTDTKGTYAISKKSNSEIAEAIGVSSDDAAVISAITDGESKNDLFNAIADYVNVLVQSGNSGNVEAALEATRALVPDVSSMVQQTQTQTTNQVFNAIGRRLSNGSIGASQGMSSGDVLENASVWIQGLANHAKLDRRSGFRGFKADTYGVALGLEKKIDNAVRVGVGYAYSKTDVDAKRRDTKIKTHTLLAYGEYKPSDWFVNGIISYGWSDYKEDKKVISRIVKAKYDVETLGMQAMVGYDLSTQYATITPETGLRYIHIDSDNYVDSSGQNVKSDSSNIITGVIGSKVSKTIELAGDLKLTPEVKLAMIYDLKRANNKSNVILPNGSSYSVRGKNLDRFGVEVSGGLSAEINGHVEMSLGYEGNFRKDYRDHSGLVNLKYRF